VTGAGFNTESLVLRLTPLALLNGRVIDESGDPVRNAQVGLYVESHGGGFNRIVRAGFGVTDDQGSYEFASLEPRNYYVSVAAKPWYACIRLPLMSMAWAIYLPVWIGRWTLLVRVHFTMARPTAMVLRPFASTGAIMLGRISTSIRFPHCIY
jgi:Carboxypeptidase regulatory-like domain